jgi:3-hydroxyisobutyrate dehydrogenase
MGEVGSGQVCKACNQIAVTLALLGVCESLSLAKKSGLDLQKTIDVLGAGAGGSWQMNNLGPRIARGELEPGFMIDLLVKDLRIVREEAAGLGLTLEGATLAERLFRELQAEGLGAQGTQALSRALENSGGFRFAGSAADATDNDP